MGGRNAITGYSVLALLFFGATLANAQDEVFSNPIAPGFQAGGAPGFDNRPVETSIILSWRASDISGTVDSGLDYGDLFGSGSGFDLEGRMLWSSPGVDWILGGYLSIGQDSFNGQTDTDDFGDSLTTSDLDITTIVAGFMGSHRFGDGFYFDGRVGFGLANYDSVDGTLRIDFGPPTGIVVIDFEVFGASSAVLFEFGGSLGYGVDSFFVEMGLGFRFQGAPDNGDLDFSSSAPGIGIFELGAGIRF